METHLLTKFLEASEDQVVEASFLLKVCCEEQNGEALISDLCPWVETEVMVFTLTLPAAVSEEGLGQDVGLWRDLVPQQRLHTYDLKDISTETSRTSVQAPVSGLMV